MAEIGDFSGTAAAGRSEYGNNYGVGMKLFILTPI